MRGGVPLNQAYDSLVSPESTLAMIGWQDTDQDGIFDVADVPLSLLGNGFYDAENLTYRLVVGTSCPTHQSELIWKPE